MTFKRLIAVASLCFILTTLLSAQTDNFLNDTLRLSSDQLQRLESLAADSASGELSVPNVFSPNGDGINDYFEVTTDGVSSYDFTIFTRTGTRIFRSSSTRIFWDGNSIGGEELPEGIYYYVIEETGSSGSFKNAGVIHLYR